MSAAPIEGDGRVPRSGAPLLALRGIGKRFGTTAALSDVDLEVDPGEVHAVLGENGAGKSTLMRVIYGLVAPDAGTMRWRGAPVRFAGPAAARRAGIGMVHQEFALVDALSVIDNLALSMCPTDRWIVRRDAVAARAEAVGRELGLDLGDLRRPAGALPVGRRQAVEIVKALAGNTALLILDEPTAVLTPADAAGLFRVLDRLRRAGAAVLFITHKLPEVVAIADRVTVLRHGRVVGRLATAATTEAELARLMVGPLAAPPAPPHAARPDAPSALTLEQVSVDDERGVPALRDVNLTLRAGETLGIAGVDGNGQAELFAVLAGLCTPSRGTVRIGNRAIARFTPAAIAAAGIACIPPDRLREGVVAEMSVVENALLNAALRRRLSPGMLTRPDAERREAQAMVDAYAIRAGSLDAPVRTLSGGNVQKLIVARALATAPRVLVAASPTRGLDIAAARAVHTAIDAALTRGAAALLISTDLDELLARAQRIAVLYRGHLSGAFERPFPVAAIGAAMAGSIAA
jgi:ABC-type uncharacterized transport system ATPase subunit